LSQEAIGALAKLTHTDGRTRVVSVEYNQLEPLLLATGFAEGDVNEVIIRKLILLIIIV